MELKPVKCSVEEQETTITFDRTSNRLCLYTSDNTRITKMQKLINTQGTAWKLEKEVMDSNGNPTGYFFSCSDKGLLTLRVKKVDREYTEEQKEALRERLKNVNKTK